MVFQWGKEIREGAEAKYQNGGAKENEDFREKVKQKK